MANSQVFISHLESGRCYSTIEVRLLRFWEARNVRCGDELMSIDMLLLDSKTAATLVRRQETTLPLGDKPEKDLYTNMNRQWESIIYKDSKRPSQKLYLKVVH